jgi:3-polyprenyl-4-hydroxybenzoate decarboxylase
MKVVVGISPASGAVYGRRLVEKLRLRDRQSKFILFFPAKAPFFSKPE